MITCIRNGRVIADGAVRQENVYLNDGKILAVTNDSLPCERIIDADGLYVSPGFVDLHTHGAAGYDFSAASPEQILDAVRCHLSHGTTTILPTITSASPQVVRNALNSLRAALELPGSYPIAGAHLEGPYFSPAMAGGQDPAFITPPIREDYTAICEEFPGLIRRWSYAPERDADQDFCRYITERGIIPSAGHTEAIYGEMKAAHEAGCNLITHLYSCTSTITRDHGFRRLGVIECAYLWDDMDVEIIADGCHLPPELIRLIVKLKGVDRVSLITDSLKVTGTNETEGVVGSIPFVIEDGVCKLLDRSAFAGSIATADRLVRVCVFDAGISLPDAITMAAANPARILGLNKGRIAPGYDADILLFDEGINIDQILISGQTLL